MVIVDSPARKDCGVFKPSLLVGGENLMSFEVSKVSLSGVVPVGNKDLGGACFAARVDLV